MMQVIINNSSGESLVFNCSKVDYTANNDNGIDQIIFHNPSINIPDCFSLSKVKSFEDSGSVLTINLW